MWPSYVYVLRNGDVRPCVRTVRAHSSRKEGHGNFKFGGNFLPRASDSPISQSVYRAGRTAADLVVEVVLYCVKL